MKKITFIATFVFIFTSSLAHAINTVNLEVVKPEQIDRCQIVNPLSMPVRVGEITWESPDRSIGVTSTKEGSHPVTLSTPIETVITESFNNFFKKCQFKVATKDQAAIVIDITIQDFFVKAENALVVGKTNGSSRFNISFNNTGKDTYTTETYFIEREYKTGPTKKLARLEKVINLILVDSINEIAGSKSFYETIGTLSK